MLPTQNQKNLPMEIATLTKKQIGQNRQKKIMEHLQTWEYSTTKLLAKILNLGYTQIYRNVQNLIKKGFVQEEKYLKINFKFSWFANCGFFGESRQNRRITH